MSYDLLFGHTGLLSFGHALYFAAGVYVMAIALEWHWELWQAVLVTLAVGIVLPIVVGSVSLRVERDRVRDGHARVRAGGLGARAEEPEQPDRRGGGASASSTTKLPVVARRRGQHEVPLLARARLPRLRRSSIVRWALDSSPGHVWQAIRENEQRVEVIGLRPFASS